jgi:uncharacterized protein (DUF1800 family)
MELHTLGVDGGYSQQDVVAVARAFSGWTIYDPGKYGEFQFNPAGHDRKEKVILGRTLPAGRGEQDGMEVVDILAHHASTAKFISNSRNVSLPTILRNNSSTAGATFSKTDGDLRAVLQTICVDRVPSEGARQSLKSPLEMAVSAVRALSAEVIDTSLAQRIRIWASRFTESGTNRYPNTNDAWTNTASCRANQRGKTGPSGGRFQE